MGECNWQDHEHVKAYLAKIGISCRLSGISLFFDRNIQVSYEARSEDEVSFSGKTSLFGNSSESMNFIKALNIIDVDKGYYPLTIKLGEEDTVKK